MIQIQIFYECGGIDASAQTEKLRVTKRIDLDPKVISTYDDIQTIIERNAPEGWMCFDPWTNCCYCPNCWASILSF